MEVRTIGLNKIFVAEIGSYDNETMPAKNTQTVTNWFDIGDVYQSTAKLTDDDANIVTHKSETSKKKIVLTEPGDCKLELSLMDPSLDELVRIFGGTKVAINEGSDTKYKWTRPRNYQGKAFALIAIPEDGDALLNPACIVVPKFEITYSATGIMLCPMTIYLNGEVTFSPEYSKTNTPLYSAS